MTSRERGLAARAFRVPIDLGGSTSAVGIRVLVYDRLRAYLLLWASVAASGVGIGSR